MQNRKLKNDISTAIAWGTPDRESYGYSSTEFTKLLGSALRRIEYLEAVLNSNNVQYTKTDREAERIHDI